MVKLKISSALFFLSLCSLSILPACTFKGPHKPVSGGAGAEKAGGGPGGGDGGGDGRAIVTYSDVKSIFETRCATCHLMNHKWTIEQSAAEAKRDIIRTRVENSSMPLAGSEQAKAITAEERAKIIAWTKGEPVGGKPAVSVSKTPATSPSPSGGNSSSNNPADSAQPAANAKTAFIERCQACHGEKGLSASPTIPNLAGSDREYILARLAYFSRPDAKGTMMPETLKALAKEFNLKDDKDKATMDLLNGVAEFFSQLKLPVTAAEKAAERAKLSQADSALYQKGLGVVTANNCVSCHLGAEGKPVAGAPMIFSQKTEFILSRFKDFRVLPADGAVANPTGDQTMPMIIKDISDEDLNAAAFYLGLTAPEEAPTAQ